jgi:hypothetical protein
MDPNDCLRLIQDACGWDRLPTKFEVECMRYSDSEAGEHAYNLLNWLDMGGFEPIWGEAED